MARVLAVALAVVALAGCGGGSALKGTLAWQLQPRIPGVSSGHQTGHNVSGVVRNTTSHAVNLDPGQWRLLDASGRKVKAKFNLGARHLAAGGATPLSVTWNAGKPVRIDYGQGTLALPSG